MNEFIKHDMKKSELTAAVVNTGGVLIHTLMKIGSSFVSGIVIVRSGKGYRIGFKEHKTGKIIKKVEVKNMAEVKSTVFAA